MKRANYTRSNAAKNIMAVAILTACAGTHAATFTVNTTADNVGSCTPTSCSLRAAISAANLQAGADTIEFSLTGTQTYKLTRTGADEDANDRGDLDITDSLTINGKGRTATVIDGNYTDRVFHIMAGKTVTIKNLKVSKGKLTSTNLTINGAGVWNQGTATFTNVLFDNNQVIGTVNNGGYGGAIHSRGPWDPINFKFLNATLTVKNSKFTNNCSDSGGAIESLGSLTVTDTVFDGNKTVVDANNATLCRNGDGAAIHVEDTPSTSASVDRSTFKNNKGTVGGISAYRGTITVKNSTFSGNTGTSGMYMYSGPGAIGNEFAASITVKNSTIANNTSTPSSSGVVGAVIGAMTLQNTIITKNVNVTNNAAADCGGTPTSSGNNVFGTLSGCGLTKQTTDFVGDAKLDVAKTDTTTGQTYIPILAGSPAIDKANAAACSTYDQLNKSRPVDGDANGIAVCDIGAWEKR